MRRLALIMSSLILGLNVASSAISQQATRSMDLALPPSTAYNGPEYSVVTPPVDGLKLGPLTIRFGQTLLQEVVDQVGSGSVQGNQPNSAWLCYQWRTPFPSYHLWLLNDVLSKTVGAAIWKRGTVPAEANCAELPQEFRPVTLSNGLALEDSPEAINISRNIYIPNLESGQAGIVFHDVVPGCGNGGAHFEGALYVQWRNRSIYSLIARLDRGSC